MACTLIKRASARSGILKLEWRGWRIEVIDLDGARIDKLLVSRIAVD